MDTVSDVTATHTGSIGGYTRAQCVAITDANVVMLKDKLIKKLLLPPISMQHWLMSLIPKELHNNETNFFSFVGNWCKQMQAINQHMRSFHLHNVFMVVQMGHRQRQNAGGALQFQLDGAGNPIQDAIGNPIPEMEDCMQEVGNPFNAWNNLGRIEVLQSCRIYYQHAEDVDCQNLTWFYELLLKNIDSMLLQH